LQHAGGGPAESDISRLERLERLHRGLGHVSRLMRQKPETLASAGGLALEGRLVSPGPILSQRPGNGLVQAQVQRTKIIRADGGVQFDGQAGHGLTDVAIVLHDLRHGEPLKQQLVPVEHRAPSYLWTGAESDAQRIHHLIEKQRDAVIELRRGRGAVVTAPVQDNSELHAAIETLVRVARSLGVAPQTTTALVKEALR